MGLGIIFLMWELGQPYKMFPQILTLAHFLFERGGLCPSWLCLESYHCSSQSPEAQKMLRRKRAGNPQSSQLPHLTTRSHGRQHFLCSSVSKLLMMANTFQSANQLINPYIIQYTLYV